MTRKMHLSAICWLASCLSLPSGTLAFQMPISSMSSTVVKNPTKSLSQTHPYTWRKSYTALASNQDPSEESSESESIFDRFLNPKIDDAGLPLADALIAQVVAPTFQITWLTINHAPRPSWLEPIFADKSLLYEIPRQGTLLAPALIHGAGLAACWTLGALAAKGYDSDAFNISGGRGYGTVIARIIQAGAFATGVLIFSTQVDLLLEFGRNVQPGESDETDFRLLTAIVELINDIVFEAVTLSGWRIYRASLTGNASGRPDNYEP